ncbi:hypothetical protein NKH60_33715, partial [Mesorhizobium sp. M1006]
HHKVSTYFGGHLMHQSTQQQKVRGNSRLRFGDTYVHNDASSKGSLSFVFRTPTCSDLVRTFHPTLTTTALYRSSLDWFETCS